MSKTPFHLSLAATLGLASGLFLSACDRGENAPTSAAPASETVVPLRAPTAYENAVMDLKVREQDLARLDAGMREIAVRFGSPIQARTLPAAVDPAAADENGSPGSALGKVAATHTHWYMAKAINFGTDTMRQTVVMKTLRVDAGNTIDVYTTHPAGSNVDPYLVGFYSPNLVYPYFTNNTIVGISDDDGGNLDAHFTWKNTTGEYHVVNIVAHAFSPDAVGPGTLTIKCKDANNHSCGSSSTNGTMGGVVVRTNSETPAAGCTGPTSTNINLNIKPAGGDGAALLAVNKKYMSGGYIYGGGHPGNLVLDHTLFTYGGNNYLVAFTIGEGQTGNYIGFQGNLYTCP